MPKKGEIMYIDDKGYLRFRDSKKLVHRWIAYNKIYKPNENYYKERYPEHSFAQLQVHHKNFKKRENQPVNLEILTRKEHQKIHTDIDKILKKKKPTRKDKEIKEMFEEAERINLESSAKWRLHRAKSRLKETEREIKPRNFKFLRWIVIVGIFLLFLTLAQDFEPSSNQESNSRNYNYQQVSSQAPSAPQLPSTPEPEVVTEPEPSPEPVIETFQFEFQKRIMTDEEIRSEIDNQIAIYRSKANVMRERNVHSLANSWDLSTERSGIALNPRRYAIFTSTLDSKNIMIEFETSPDGYVIGDYNAYNLVVN